MKRKSTIRRGDLLTRVGAPSLESDGGRCDRCDAIDGIHGSSNRRQTIQLENVIGKITLVRECPRRRGLAVHGMKTRLPPITPTCTRDAVRVFAAAVMSMCRVGVMLGTRVEVVPRMPSACIRVNGGRG